MNKIKKLTLAALAAVSLVSTPAQAGWFSNTFSAATNWLSGTSKKTIALATAGAVAAGALGYLGYKWYKKRNTTIPQQPNTPARTGQQQLNDSLIEAALRGDTEEVRRLVALGANPNARNANGIRVGKLVENQPNQFEILRALGSQGDTIEIHRNANDNGRATFTLSRTQNQDTRETIRIKGGRMCSIRSAENIQIREQSGEARQEAFDDQFAAMRQDMSDLFNILEQNTDLLFTNEFDEFFNHLFDNVFPTDEPAQAEELSQLREEERISLLQKQIEREMAALQHLQEEIIELLGTSDEEAINAVQSKLEETINALNNIETPTLRERLIAIKKLQTVLTCVKNKLETHSESSEEAVECKICCKQLEEEQHLVETGCGITEHKVCATCLSQIDTCPFCREDI